MFVTHGMTVTVIFWAAIVAVVFVSSFFRYRERASRHRMVETLAEKGQPVPPDLISNGRDYDRGGSPVASGIFLMCIGIALAIFFWAMGGGGALFDGDRMPNWLPVVGIFPFMIGVARILSALFDRPRR